MNKQVELVVNWWADQITSNALSCDNGDDSAAGGLAFLLGNSLALQARQNIGANEVSTFKQSLSEKLQAYHERRGHYPILSVDYGPEDELAEAAQEAGISAQAFPWKSATRISGEDVECRLGYGNPWRPIIESATEEVA